ncbi:unnamed protein product [Symbiodinium sp. CCMP2592]|nr:unnamed protein product [Symbiodinium sp. CCMP2592]
MDGFLRALFLSKGFQEEQLDTIEAKDKDLRSVNDLAAGATSEDDARAWSEELGLSGRVQKSRFVQAWAEARTQANIGRPAQSSAPAANGYVDVAPASKNATPAEPPPAPVDPPRAVERYVEEEDTQEDWSWVKVSRPVETRVALSYIDGEPVSRPGGVSDLLRSSFRTHGLTSIEVAQLEQMLEARSRTALAVAAATPEGAMRLARSCGVHSKVSQENFAKAWHEAAAAMVALAPGPAPTEKRSLSELTKEKDFEACTKALMQKANVARPKDLLPLLRGMLEHLAVQEQLVSSETKQAKSKSKVLPALASLYGAEALECWLFCIAAIYERAGGLQFLVVPSVSLSMDEQSQYTMMAMGLLQQQLLQNAFSAISQPNAFHEQLATLGSWYTNAPHGSMMPPSSIAPCGTIPDSGYTLASGGPHLSAPPPPPPDTFVKKDGEHDTFVKKDGEHDNTPSRIECRFGRRCTRKDCWFLHPRGRLMDSSPQQSRSRERSRSPKCSRDSNMRSLSNPRPPTRRCLDGSLNAAWASDDSPLPGPEDEVSKPSADTAQKPHDLLRDTPVPWPRVISSSGRLKDVKTDGHGWALHFLNPNFPRMAVTLDDLQAVILFMKKQGLVTCEKPQLASPGVLQVKFGKGAGNLQVYPGSTGRSSGNARINSSKQEQVRSIRSALLRSQWFHDAGAGRVSPLDVSLQVTQTLDGKLLLPAITPSSRIVDLKTVLKMVAKKLGELGKAAIKDYLQECGLHDGHEVWPHLEAAFVSNKGRGKRKAQ